MPRSLIYLLLIISLVVVPCASATSPPASFSIAFYYAPNPPLNELKAFDIVVVDPDAVGVAPSTYATSQSQLFAYLSVGEADPNRSWYSKMKPNWLVADNQVWKSKVVDLSNAEWRSFFLDSIVEPLWAAGYRGFFLDTLDSFQLIKDQERYPAQEEGLVQTIRDLKKRHPEARLILNRGFEVLERVKDVAFAVAAESLYQNFDPSSGTYGAVAERDRQWLLNRFAEVKKAGLPVISIDYVTPDNRDLARSTAAKIRNLGFIPWVTDKDLRSLGVGAVEVLPRMILGLYNASEGPDPVYSNLHRLAVMPLNYLGYQVELQDLAQPLPGEILAGRYAGVLVWPNTDQAGAKSGLLDWVKRQTAQGVPVVFLDRFGFSPALADQLPGVQYRAGQPAPRELALLHSSPLMLLEKEPRPVVSQFVPLKLTTGKALVTIGSPDGRQVSDAVAITPWGGYALEPFVVVSAIDDQPRWILDPFEFFQQALRLRQQPAPDTTTENGSRLLLTHIDGDGFESRSEWPGGRYAATELRERILTKYRIPTAFSVITSSLGDHGLFPESGPSLQAEARSIFALPWIEAASHTFSHPFYWQNSDMAKEGHAAQYLPIPGYTFSLAAEIAGSIGFIEKNLLPPGKRVRLLQWSGDCTPDSAALELAEQSGVATINGGYTAITESNRGIALIAPLGVEKGRYFQVFAPNQNENVYTNHWKGPFYGYRRVIETFRMTDTPRRLKPLNIYYHVYSMTKLSSWKALDDVYTWALAQKPNPVYATEYVKKVLDFNRTVIARDDGGWLIRNRGDLRQVRVPVSAGYPDLVSSRGVIGFSDFNAQRYIHLEPGGDAVLKLTDTAPTRPLVATATGRVYSFAWTSSGIRLSISAHVDGHIQFANATGCRLLANGKPGVLKQEGPLHLFHLVPGSHELELVCK